MAQTIDIEVLKLVGPAGSETQALLAVDAAAVGNPAPGSVIAAHVLDAGNGQSVLAVGLAGEATEEVEALEGLPVLEGKALLVTDTAEIGDFIFTPGTSLLGYSFGPSLLIVELVEPETGPASIGDTGETSATGGESIASQTDAEADAETAGN